MTNKVRAAMGTAIVLALGTAGCSSSHHAATAPPAGSTTTVAASGTTAATVAPSTTTVAPAPAPTTTVATTASSAPGPCPTSALKGNLTGAQGTAGSIYYQLELTNESTTACVIEGYPGVSFVTGSQGGQVGAPAARTTGTVAAVTLAAGVSASATLQITEAGNYSDCGVTPTTGLRVYPPGQTASLLVLHDDRACSNTHDVTLHVGPFHH